MSWHVLLYEAVERWIDDRSPSPEQVVGLERWLVALVDNGPPPDAIAVPFTPDLYAVRAEEADAVVTFLVIAYERLIILKSVE